MSLLSMFGRLALTPLRNSGDLLHKTIWLTLSNVPGVQASFTSERDRELHSTTTQRIWAKALNNSVQLADERN